MKQNVAYAFIFLVFLQTANAASLNASDKYFISQLEQAFPNGVTSGVEQLYDYLAASHNFLGDIRPNVDDFQTNADIRDLMDVIRMKLDNLDRNGMGPSRTS